MSILSGFLLILGGAAFFADSPLAGWLWAASAATGIWFVLPAAFTSARLLSPDMNLLMTVAVIGASCLGDWFEAASTAFLFSFALLLETWTAGRARSAIQALLEITPSTARVVMDLFGSYGPETETPVAQVRSGQTIVIRPGDRLPLDGTVLTGETEINQAPLTGESTPIYKGPGSEVLAGTINGDGVVYVKVTKPANDTTLSRIMRMVREAQSRRAPVSRWVDRFAAVYTPTMMLFSLLTATVPPLLGLGDFSEWIRRGLVVLVTACPCALAISTPVSIVAGLTSAVRAGVLIKGGAYLEAASHINAVAFDKTGTLTTGSLRVKEAIPAHGRTRDELLALAASLEGQSTHPAGRAIHAYATASPIAPAPLAAITNLPGLGIKGMTQDAPVPTTCYAGSPRLFERTTGRPFSPDLLSRPLREGDIPQALVFTGSELVGVFILEDTPRTESAPSLRRLKALGVSHTAMLTGDAEPTAQRIGREAGVDAIHANLMPDDKVALVHAIKKSHGHTAMVGDGINDAPALAAADLGIAMGAAGSAAAIETADIALMSDDLAKLPWLVDHARHTLAVIRQNIVFALGTKAVFILFALAGTVDLWMAVAADMGTSLLVTANGLRLIRRR